MVGEFQNPGLTKNAFNNVNLKSAQLFITRVIINIATSTWWFFVLTKGHIGIL